MKCYFWWIGMWKDIHQHINTWKLCIQFPPSRLYTQPNAFGNLEVPFTGCAMDCIRPLPTSSKGHQYAQTFISLLMSYLVKVPLKTKSADEVSMVYMKEILPKSHAQIYFAGWWYQVEKWTINICFQFSRYKTSLQQPVLPKRKWQDRECLQLLKVHHS